jgi:WD40 repeat protein
MVAVSVVGLAAGGMTGMSFGESLLMMGGIPPIPSAGFIRQACYRAAAISPDGLTIITTTRGPSHNVMAVIDRKENEVLDKWTANSSVCDLQFSPDGKLLVAATSRGVILIDTMTWKKTGRL